LPWSLVHLDLNRHAALFDIFLNLISDPLHHQFLLLLAELPSRPHRCILVALDYHLTLFLLMDLVVLTYLLHEGEGLLTRFLIVRVGNIDVRLVKKIVLLLSRGETQLLILVCLA
jgi:hypothetical protein